MSPQHIKTLKLNIDAPIKMETDIELKELNLIAGMNGTGKTLIMVVAWVLGYLSSSIAIKLKFGIPVSNLESAQFAMDKCFDDQNFNGTIEAIFASGKQVKIVIDKGKVINVIADIDGTEDIQAINFMSSHMRTFTAIKSYLVLRKTLVDSGKNEAELMESISETYKLYDIVYLEGIIRKMPKLLPDIIVNSLESLGFKEKVVEIGIDFDKPDFYAKMKDGERKYLSTFSNGEQAMLNMMLAHL